MYIQFNRWFFLRNIYVKKQWLLQQQWLHRIRTTDRHLWGHRLRRTSTENHVEVLPRSKRGGASLFFGRCFLTNKKNNTHTHQAHTFRSHKFYKQPFHTHQNMILVQHEALLCVLSRDSSHPSRCDTRSPIEDEEFVLVDIPKPFKEEVYSDDDSSLCTASTNSLSTDSSSACERRVTFAPELVSEEWTREFTPKEEVSKLFYSSEETQR